MKNSMLIAGVVAVILGVSGFYAGMQYQKGQQPGAGQYPGGMQQTDAVRPSGVPGRSQSGKQFQPVNGQISTVDATGITVKMTDGSSKIVVVSDSTVINRTTNGSKSDLKTGENVMVVGSSNSDNSVTAQTISIGGSLRNMGQPPQGDNVLPPDQSR